MNALNNNVLWSTLPTGETNTVNNDLDMNGKRIYNLPIPVNDSEPVRVKDVKDKNTILGFIASAISFSPTTQILSTNVQAAIVEVFNYFFASQLTDYVALRNYTGYNKVVNITSQNLAGIFIYDAADTTSLDNNATIIVDTSNRRWKRQFNDLASVKWFGAIGNGVANDTTAFTNARTVTGGVYYIPNGSYVINGFDPFADCYKSGDNVTLIVDGISYNSSNSIAGALRLTTDSNVLTSLRHAKTGNILQQWQNGNGGTATYFYRGLAFKTDSHWCQVKPASLNGSVDLLWQRSDLNADPNGNRFNETYNESVDRLDFSYATTASGAPNFDSYMQIYAGTSPELIFPALPATFNQGFSTQARSGATFGVSFSPKTTSVISIKDSVGGTEIGTIDLTNGFIFKNLGWSDSSFGSAALTYITGGVAIAVSGASPLAFFQNGGETWRFDTSGNFIPGFDNAFSIGSASKRPSVLFAATGTINTSDENAKTEIEEIPQSWLDAWSEVDYCRFKYRDSVLEKGKNARWHVGLIAQKVKEAFEKRGIDPFEIGILCYDEWEDQYTDEIINGVPVPKISKKAGSLYGIRYEEALALECAYLRSKLK